jgi:hypothetical protein
MEFENFNETSGTQTPWELSDFSDHGEAAIVGAPGSETRYGNYSGQRVICEVILHDAENAEDFKRVQIDARRIIAAVNFTQHLPLALLESMAEEPLSPPSTHTGYEGPSP